MPHSQKAPRRETRTVKLIDENDPSEEILPLSNLDAAYVKIYLPITSTYKLGDDVDKEVVVSNLCEGFRRTTKEYRHLGGYIYADSTGKCYVKRTAAHGTLTVHINHLEDTEFPTYQELEKRDFPFSELNEMHHMPPDYAIAADPNLGRGFPVAKIQLNFIRGGLIIGTAIHHQCVDIQGFDVVMERWAANTRSLFTGEVPPPFDLGCLDPAPFCSTTPLSPDQFDDVQAKVKSFKFTPVLPNIKTPPFEQAHTIFHIPLSRLSQLKASAKCDTGKWVSTNDCISVLFWQTMTRARLPGKDDDVHLHQTVNIRAYNDPPLPEAYPGNTLSVSWIDSTAARLLHGSTFGELAQDVRAAVVKWRSPSMIKDTKDYLASFPLKCVRPTFAFSAGLSTTVSSWGIVSAYQTHDFGFGPLSALRFATDTLNNLFIIYPRRPKAGDVNEGIEVQVMMEKGAMERLRQDPELLEWAEVRTC
ncbi:Benzyl alcohol O-benzoyltransferase [Lasiodiplodia hormozganensis]|uniref:Benzyl alcohol O-benzoyltransferase n=1 Tax=Lasiodiplodia hormozganensis TaxID=869390 RepID=A0AA39YLS3_9PEZI|nr:Benzyl alcohol O-benzoyltransferase [Lasiodiplodia hormozganensis]